MFLLILRLKHLSLLHFFLILTFSNLLHILIHLLLLTIDYDHLISFLAIHHIFFPVVIDLLLVFIIGSGNHVLAILVDVHLVVPPVLIKLISLYYDF